MNRHLHRRRKQRGSMLALGAAAASLSAVLAGPAALAQEPIVGQDGSLTFLFNKNIGNNPSPTATLEGYWLKSVIRPLIIGGDRQSGTVFIDLISNLESPSEYIESVGFNLLRPITGFQAECTAGDSIGCPDSASKPIGNPAVKVEYLHNQSPNFNLQNNAKGFDIKISLPTSGNNGDRLQSDETATFKITGDNLTPADFYAFNEPYDNGTVEGLYSAAHVQGIPGGFSTTIADPPGTSSVPGPLPLLGAGVALGYSRRLRQRLRPGQVLG